MAEAAEITDAASGFSRALSVLRDSGLLTPEAEQREAVLEGLLIELADCLCGAKQHSRHTNQAPS